MEIIRTIHPVGQGGFYTETLESDSDKHTVVYDCGGSSKKSMEEYLKKYLHKDSSGNRMEIDAVFISHLHADHINGLEYLLKNADVKYLILPQLTNEMILEALVYNRIQSNRAGTQINNLVLDLYGENDHYGTTKIIKVEFAGLEDRINIEQEGDEVDLSGDVKVGIVKSKTIFYPNLSGFISRIILPQILKNQNNLRISRRNYNRISVFLLLTHLNGLRVMLTIVRRFTKSFLVKTIMSIQ